MQTEDQNPAMPDVSLAEFPVPSYEEWKGAAIAALKGAPFEKVMFTKLVDGLTLNPIYNQEDAPADVEAPGSFPYRRGTSSLGYTQKPWRVAQTVYARNPKDFNELAKAELAAGGTALTIDLRCMTGTVLRTVDAWKEALAGIDLTTVPVYLITGGCGATRLAMLAAAAEALGIPTTALSGGVQYDPYAILLTKGKLCGGMSAEGAMKALNSMTRWAIDHASADFTTIGIDGTAYQNAGAAAPDEMAAMLATAVAYLRGAEAEGLSVEQVAPRIGFNVGIGNNLFLEVCKLRALRMLWARIVRACGGSDEAAKIRMGATTSGWTMSKTDPWVNMLRGTSQAFAAVLGGTEWLNVLPFDLAVRRPGSFSARIARNTQLMLAGEFCLDKEVDPAGGSYYVENMTETLAKEAWTRFQEIEAAGGMLAVIKDGSLSARISATCAQRLKLADQRRQGIVGVNRYVNLTEAPLEPAPEVEVPAKPAPACVSLESAEMSALISAAAAGHCTCNMQKALADLCGTTADHLPGMPEHRLSERFEALQARSAAWLAAHGERPKIYLANQGPLRQHKARADFSQDFLRAGGLDTVYADGAASPEESAAACAASGCKACVICSTDDTYPEIVPAYCAALKAAAPDVQILLAGYPAEHIDSFRAAGVDEFIHIKANCHDVLDKLQTALGL